MANISGNAKRHFQPIKKKKEALKSSRSYGVSVGERTKLPRYAFDPDLKPAIVGSYSYDMVKGKFILPDTNRSTTEINLTDIILSTTSNSSIIDDSYRKHVGITESKSMFKWWTRSRLSSKNSTNRYLTLFKGIKIANLTTTKSSI